MSRDFVMPSLGADMASATLLEWWVKPGDRVKKGDVIAVVETSKGAIEIEVFTDGVVEEILVPAGQEVAVGTVMAHIDAAEGDAEAGPASTPASAPASAPRPGVESGSEPAEPSAQPPAEPQIEPPTPTVQPERPGQSQTAIGKRQPVSPAARRLAREQGLDLAMLQGAGKTVHRQDVKQALATQTPATPAPEVASSRPDRPGMRQAIAAAMTRSKREIPHYYLAERIDLRAASVWLSQFNSERPPQQRLLMSALLLRATALALQQYPQMNGFYRDDHFLAGAGIHMGVAISLRGGGLVTPAIHEVDKLSPPDLMRHLLDMTERARRGQLRSSEVTDATVTVTALGERGVESVYGVIFPPQVAIVGFGKVSEQPCVVGDGIAIHPMVQATLAADHRVSDGHLGARFLAAIATRLQHPEQL
ncbi:MAG: dihydrolipoamide acetyltransferase family protein [Alcanivorax sp.]|nr:dihydrolipoamide acetyltransferase family protein [Alcanivorax sp.]